MKKLPLLTLLLFSLPWHLLAQCPMSYDVVVALDGSGDFTSVQAAIDAAPGTGPNTWVIFIKNGTYDEKLYIEKSFLSFIGEDREKTVIRTAELRRLWRKKNTPGPLGADWGSATVNISPEATDLLFASLTLLNNFAEVYPDTIKPNDHTFTIRGGGNRVILFNCNVISTGGDTCSLWNNENDGMYYHRGCYFSGWVDFLCPRGFCYVEDCDFYSYSKTASIWHDGSANEKHILVLRNCRFDGVPGFALGRYHRDGNISLLDCAFSENMNDQPIYLAASGKPLTWGERVYYANCHREDGNYAWHTGDLEINTRRILEATMFDWVFQNKWDPEALIEGILPTASMPRPANGQQHVEPETVWGWVPGRCVDSYEVYLGDEETMFLRERGRKGTVIDKQNIDGQEVEFMQAGNSFYPKYKLKPGTKYFWRVDEITETGEVIQGPLWHFTTKKEEK